VPFYSLEVNLRTRFFFSSRTYVLTLTPIEFILRSVQTHISKHIRIEMCVCTLLKANPIGRRVRAHALSHWHLSRDLPADLHMARPELIICMHADHPESSSWRTMLIIICAFACIYTQIKLGYRKSEKDYVRIGVVKQTTVTTPRLHA